MLKYDILSHLLLIPYMVRVSRKFKCRKVESLHVVKNYLKSDNYNKFQVLKYDILSYLLLNRFHKKQFRPQQETNRVANATI